VNDSSLLFLQSVLLEKNGQNIRRVCEAAKSRCCATPLNQALQKRPQCRGRQQQQVAEQRQLGHQKPGPESLHSESA